MTADTERTGSARSAIEEGQALASLLPAQRERLELAVNFIMPHDESVGIVDALGCWLTASTSTR